MYVNRALSPRKRLTVMMQNHTKWRFQPWVKRSRVMANEVLLQAAAVMESTPETLLTKRYVGQSVIS
jgi:hypothetical protein